MFSGQESMLLSEKADSLREIYGRSKATNAVDSRSECQATQGPAIFDQAGMGMNVACESLKYGCPCARRSTVSENMLHGSRESSPGTIEVE
ncbi:hypothetical protein A6X21_15375 [Planctopirus hydrillae]|uniref:Uncharacterized protein n=1 Tax=Planctopirus hydrillae TaxID=1841610 RepID=A0A1C3EUA9_9PLAN|nr:hypothetical protein A6X21_15375 [Planctopirus hydrillae]